jgi:hypothetical protein
VSEDELVAASSDSSNSSSRMSHQIDEDSDQGDVGNSGAYSEDEREQERGSEFTLDHWTTDATEERRMTDTPEKRRTPSASKVHEDGELFPEIANAPIDETDTADRGPQETRVETGGSSEALGNGMMCTVLRSKLTCLPVDTVATCQQLVSVNQTEFTIEGQPTRRGRIHRTRDMVEVTACICGQPVESGSRNSNTAVQCGYRGCETLWVSLCPATAPTSQFFAQRLSVSSPVP